MADIFRGGLGRVTLLGTSLAAIALLGTWGSVQWVPSWADRMAGADGQVHLTDGPGLGAMVACILAGPFAQLTNRRLATSCSSARSLASCAYLFRGGLHYRRLPIPAWVFIAGATRPAFTAGCRCTCPNCSRRGSAPTGQGFAYNAGRIFDAAGSSPPVSF